jgi:hypothetical protein
MTPLKTRQEMQDQINRIENMLIKLTQPKRKRVEGESRSNLKALRATHISGECSRWWEVYPLKKAKAFALKSFTKAVSKMGGGAITDFTDEIIADVQERLRKDADWSEGFAIPYPATYLNGKRWEDAIKPIPKDTTKPPRPEHISSTYQVFDPLARGDDGLDDYNKYAEDM